MGMYAQCMHTVCTQPDTCVQNKLYGIPLLPYVHTPQKDGGDCSSAEGEVDHQQEVHSGLETRSTGAEVLSLPLACPSDPCRDQSHNPVVCKALLEACRVGDVQCVEDTLSKHG